MKVSLGTLGLAFVVSIHLVISTTARAQDDGGPQPILSRALSATVDYGDGNVFQPSKADTDFQRLGLDPGQLITITVQFPLDLAGQAMIAEPLDGGILTQPDNGLFVDSDGNVIFQFQAIDSFGACRIAVHQPDDSNFVYLWVVDPEHPENTPPGLPGVY